MICLSDFAVNVFIFGVGGGLISALEYCRKMEFRIQLRLNQFKTLGILSHLNGFVMCKTSPYILLLEVQISPVLHIVGS